MFNSNIKYVERYLVEESFWFSRIFLWYVIRKYKIILLIICKEILCIVYLLGVGLDGEIVNGWIKLFLEVIGCLVKICVNYRLSFYKLLIMEDNKVLVLIWLFCIFF